MNKYILYIALSGLFGLSSILSDQYAYQIEKSIVNLEAEKKSFEHQRAESENIKNLLEKFRADLLSILKNVSI